MTILRRAASGYSWQVALLLWLLVVGSAISWRRGEIFSGGIDAVVVGKAVVAGVAALIAGTLAATARERRPVGGASLCVIAMIVSVSLLGALAAGNVLPASILAGRLILLAVTVLLIVSLFPAAVIVSTLLIAMGAIGVTAALTGYASLEVGGRLSGGVPQLAPNEVAAILLPPLVGIFHHLLVRGLRTWSVTIFAVLLAGTFLTGSRTGLAMAALAFALALLAAPRISAGAMIATIALVPVGYVVIGFTGLLQQLISRGEDASSLLTLNSRTVAWDAVLSIPADSWRWWLGAGLAQKTIPVDERYRDEQVLDSSWISALAQAGTIGTILLAAWVVIVVVVAVRSKKLRGIAVPLLALILGRSILENGLIESSVTFVAFFTLAALLERESLYRPFPKGTAPQPRSGRARAIAPSSALPVPRYSSTTVLDSRPPDEEALLFPKAP